MQLCCVRTVSARVCDPVYLDPLEPRTVLACIEARRGDAVCIVRHSPVFCSQGVGFLCQLFFLSEEEPDVDREAVSYDLLTEHTTRDVVLAQIGFAPGACASAAMTLLNAGYQLRLVFPSPT